jgi:hypothetical protein
MGRIRRGEHGGALGHALLGQAEVHIVGREQPEAAMVMLGVVPGEEDVPVGPGVWERANRSGNAGRYFSVLNCASENGLSLDRCNSDMGVGLLRETSRAVGVATSCTYRSPA